MASCVDLSPVQQIHAYGEVIDPPHRFIGGEPRSHAAQQLSTGNANSTQMMLGARPAVRLSTEYARHFSGDSVASIIESTDHPPFRAYQPEHSERSIERAPPGSRSVSPLSFSRADDRYMTTFSPSGQNKPHVCIIISDSRQRCCVSY